ncbi:MAG: polysaccharide biosynthesis protein, partial [Rhodospirillaceae bacterium]|nr:polysaccharide biosynthesis protein [Rhodospirillaceae bacterium]
MVTIIKRTLPSRLATIAFGHDVFMAAVSFGLSLGLRVGFDFAPAQAAVLLPGTAVFAAISALVFLGLRLYRGIWRYASMSDLLQLARAVSIIVIVFSLLMFLIIRLEGIPRSLPFINWFVLLALLGGPRFAYRLYKDKSLDWKLGKQDGDLIPVLLLGAGDEAELFIRASRASSGSNYYPVGILSETKGRVGREIHGVQVLGTIDDLKETISALNAKGIHPQRLVLTKDTIKGAEVSGLLKDAEALGLTLARASRAYDLKSGASDEIKTRPIAIEDLLGRPQQPLDRAAMAKLVGGKRILVTGSGGSIGSELVRQIAGLNPNEILLLENSEYALYKIDREISLSHPDVARNAVIADVRDHERLGQVFSDYHPQLVFHAAALKHVPLVEQNPFEGVM